MFMDVYDGQQLWVKDENIMITRNSGVWKGGDVVTDPTDLPTLTTAINLVIVALEGHGFWKA